VVIDTNVLVAAMRSRRGASARLVSLIGTDRFDIALSVPLFLEYEAALSRLLGLSLETKDVEAVLDYVLSVGERRAVFYLWRPVLRDPQDEMVLELAVAAQCDSIITYNKADFRGAERFGVRVIDPREFLVELGG